MSFTNVQVSLETLPRFADVEYEALHASYPRLVLGVTLVFLVPIYLAVTGFLLAAIEPGTAAAWLRAGLLCLALLLFVIFLAWFSYKSARVMRYALRQHDVIVQSGIFWRKEAVQPIRRIQHIEQHQGPVDKRFGLYELKLFSAGTGHFTFRIPGLDAETASSIRQFILRIQEDGWGDDDAPERIEPEAPEPVEPEPRPVLDG